METKKSESGKQKLHLDLISTDKSITIQYAAFKNCISLHSVIFPKIPKDKILTIEKEAFSGCKSLRTVVVWNGEAEIDTDAFRGCDTEKLVFVTNNTNTNCSVARFAREHGFQCVVADSIMN